MPLCFDCRAHLHQRQADADSGQEQHRQGQRPERQHQAEHQVVLEALALEERADLRHLEEERPVVRGRRQVLLELLQPLVGATGGHQVGERQVALRHRRRREDRVEAEPLGVFGDRLDPLLGERLLRDEDRGGRGAELGGRASKMRTWSREFSAPRWSRTSEARAAMRSVSYGGRPITENHRDTDSIPSSSMRSKKVFQASVV